MRFKITLSLLVLALPFSFFIYGNGSVFEYSGSRLEIVVDEIILGKVGSSDREKEMMYITQESLVNTAGCAILPLPLVEGFENGSLTKDCWSVLDNNGDGNSNTNNLWKISNTASHVYEGTYSMYFNGQNTGKAHDDFLISPKFTFVNAEMYQLTYYYKTSASASTEFEVSLSNSGINASDFSTILQAKAVHKVGSYTKKVIYIENVGGTVNIAWRVSSTGQSPLYIDKITLEKVDCKEPIDTVVLEDIQKDKATFSRADTLSKGWGYFVLPAGTGVGPVGSGNIATSSKVTVNSVSGTGANLTPNTEYEFYFRENCGAGKFSSWVGPVLFRTLCDVQPLPFFEGFNKWGSTTIECWNIIDNNKDSSGTNNTWSITSSDKFQGTDAMYFNGNNSKTTHDDWLISPTFNLDVTKKYRLKYHYRTNSLYESSFRVMLAVGGGNVDNFKKELLTKDKESSNIWKEETLIIDNVAGEMNIGWHVNSVETQSQLYIDNVFFEEIQTCPEPIKLGVKDVKANEATLFWTDNYGSDWEYTIQKAKSGTPKSGSAITNKEIKVTQESNGALLMHNTEYEFLVRSKCADGLFSEWTTAYVFKTSCDVFTVPFIEKFNNDSKTFGCWTIFDENKDATNFIFGPNIWVNGSTAYEGGKAMNFNGTAVAGKKHNDWLISPKIKFEAGKVYRLKYFYRTHVQNGAEYEFEVLLSTQGTDISKFNTTIVAKKSYEPSTVWKEEYVFISGVSGDVNIAWYVSLEGKQTNINIDYVVVEEVENCPEPILLDVEDVEDFAATLSWQDGTGGNNWEYFVQEEGLGSPTVAGKTTSLLKNKVTQDNNGVLLKNNTDYEFYVRTVCGGGLYSIWSGPFKFNTTCGVLQVPFWEGYNTDSQTMRCWTILDGNQDATSSANIWKEQKTGSYEGDGNMLFYSSTNRINEDWLISPTIAMDKSRYVLKYFYKVKQNASNSYINEFEVVLSNKGIDTTNFTHIIEPKNNYSSTKWVEKVVFFDGIPGDINLAWHVISENGAKNYTEIAIDNVSLEKVETCLEPYYLSVLNNTATSIEIEWEESGGATAWEVLVVNIGENEHAVPVQKTTVTITPKTTITGLDEGKGYTIYVRAKCSNGTDFSTWSTPINTGTMINSNDDCSGAITIPVNNASECINYVSGSLFGAKVSSIASPFCNSNLKNDVWFEFTATKSIHILTVNNLKPLSHTTLFPEIYGVLYEGTCGTLLDINCLVSIRNGFRTVFENLIVGQKYYLRLGNYDRLDANGNIVKDQQPDFTFDLCITSLEKSSVEISESDDQYTVEELVKDILIQTECDLVSNISYQNGDGNAANYYNTLGYFNRGESDFPFEEGVVLSTNEVKYVGRPYMGNTSFRGSNSVRWTGDKDINDAIDDAGGGSTADKRVTQLEFDFVPIKDSLSFEFLFASNSYNVGCQYACSNGALFATWLEDLTTGEKQNLAKLPNGASISIQNVADASKREPASTCGDRNPEYFGSYYALDGIGLDAPIDFAGVTTGIKSKVVPVVPGRQYHIKLAIMDFCPIEAHSSAVFFNAGSFDIGKLDLGEDMLVETNNALCEEESILIQSGITTSLELEKKIEWFKDGVLIKDANEPNLEVDSSGEYEVRVNYPKLKCSSSGSIKVEIYPAISEVVNQPNSITVCRFSLEDVLVDLSQVELEMFDKVEVLDYKTTYYETKEDAISGVSAIENVQKYTLGKKPENKEVFIYVENKLTGCHELFSFNILVEATERPASKENVKVCSSYTFPALESNQYYYTGAGATGIEYKEGDALNIEGDHTIYVLQLNGDEGCYEEVKYTVSITGDVIADVFSDATVDCELYILQPLSENNKYFTEPGGKGIQLQEGTIVRPMPGFGSEDSRTVYVYASSEDGLCVEESKFTVKFEDCPIQKGISPNGDGLNDYFDLTPHGVMDLKIYNRYGTEVYSHGMGYTKEWMGQDKDGKALPDGTYYYVVISNGKIRTGWVQINR